MNRLFSSFFIYITIFLFGMTVMKTGLTNVAEPSLKKWLFRLTDHPVKGLLMGILATMLLQSSSAVTVIVVGLTAVGLLAFRQTVGIILGANIGTTITGIIASYPVGDLKFVLLLIGVVLLFLPYQKGFTLGAVCFGLGCLFLSMDGFNALSEPLKSVAPIKKILTSADHSVLTATIFGTIFTGIIQSSSAATLVAMSLLNTSAIHLNTGIAVILGANIGTCVTALLACIGRSKAAIWVALTHALFNGLGVILFIPILDVYSKWMVTFNLEPGMTLAVAASLFNIITALMAIPFANRYGNWVENRFLSKK